MRGDIWLCFDGMKNRPVVIVGNQELLAVELDHIVARVTSQNPRNQFDVVIEEWEKAGLNKASVVRCAKINTVHHRELKFKIGKLEDSDLSKVLETIRKCF